MSNFQRRLVRVAAAAVAVIGWGAALVIAVPAALAAPLEFTFTKIADTSTPIPGGTGNFTAFGQRPSIDGGDVAFLGFGDPSFTQRGIYSTVGGPLGVVADFGTAVPGGTGNFTNFGNAPSIDGGDVAFFGISSSFPFLGIYSTVGGLNVVADLGTAIPSGTGNFTSFSFASIGGGEVAFFGVGSSGQQGTYSTVGGLNAVADLGTGIPGGTGNFTGFGNNPSIRGGNVAFRGSGIGQGGIYRTVVGGLNAVADFGTTIPGGTGNFIGFGFLSFGGGEVAFFGIGSSGQQGIYSTGGGLNAVADLGTAIPSGTGNFTSFGSNSFPSIDGGNVAFFGTGSSGQQGLYLSAGGMLQEIISLNDTLDGKTLLTLGIFTRGLSGTSIAFFASFTDGSNGIYRADADSPVPIAIDIKPGSFPNSINQGSGGVIPVAILGSDTFDATQVDGSTCTLADASVKVVGVSDKLLCSVDDVSGDFSGGPEGAPDGFLDQVCKFLTIDLGVELGDTEATIRCSAPEDIEGTDSIRIVPPV